MRCIHCGNSLKAAAGFCHHCGARATSPPRSSVAPRRPPALPIMAAAMSILGAAAVYFVLLPRSSSVPLPEPAPNAPEPPPRLVEPAPPPPPPKLSVAASRPASDTPDDRDARPIPDPAPPAARAAAEGALPQPLRVGGNIQAPAKIKDVRPIYPAIAQSARIQGVVIIEATIGVDGHVVNAQVLRSIPLLDQAALDAVREWQFVPTLLNGAPTPVIMTVTVQFSLR